jgi:hypothetical protein
VKGAACNDVFIRSRGRIKDRVTVQGIEARINFDDSSLPAEALARGCPPGMGHLEGKDEKNNFLCPCCSLFLHVL